MRTYYAQNREDLLIKSFFPDIEAGFYIDVGANDPVTDSVTKLFYDNGWRGINIEPIKRHYEELKKARPEDTNLNVGLSDKAGDLIFTEYPEGDGLSTFDSLIQKLYKNDASVSQTAQSKQYKVRVRTLQSVIEEVKPEHVHFIKIDVEGYEYEVIKGYTWQSMRPELVCIEANHIHKDWQPLLETHRYELVFFDGINNYYLAQESLHRKDYFNYPNTVLAGNPVYYPAVLEIQKEQADLISWQMMNKLGDMEQEIASLHRQQRDVRFLAKQLAKEIQLRLNKRAKGINTTDHLTYVESQELEQLSANPSSDKTELLAALHEVDKKSIGKQRPSLSHKVKPIAWKAVAGTTNAGIKIARKIKHGR